ncbi:MAG: cation:proton antiporter, partial [Longimicrobiales bacterium]|nr:cation:proton antiporter [Longimicrobiales bacterium]
MTALTLLPALQGTSQAGGAVGDHQSLTVTLVGAFVLLMVVAALVDVVAKRIKLPYTVLLVVAGALLAAVADRWEVLKPLSGLEVTPDAVFFVFLPALIFQSAFHLDARALRANLGPTLLLAVPGLLISTGLIGAVMHMAGPWVGLPLTWPEALLLGSILSATDPVADISLFSQLGDPKRLTVLVEGESLFNDATAIVISRIILGVIAAGAFTGEAVVAGALEFGAVFFGGLLVGGALAVLAATFIGRIRSDAFLEITATTVLAYVSFYLAEHTLHLSGVMAVVAAGVLIGGWGQTKISPSVSRYLEHFWDYMAGVANALIFLLVGLTVDLQALVDALPVLVWVIAAMLVSRALVIFTLVPLSSRVTDAEPVSRSYQAVMYWGGLRGGIALAIALALPESLSAKGDFVTLATGAVLFTLLVQGLTIERLVRHFRLHVPPIADQLARLEGRIAAKLNAMERLPQIQAGGLFPLRIAHAVRADMEVELARLRSDMGSLRDRALDPPTEKRLLLLRAFSTEKKLYYEMFSRGHLSEGAYRDVAHSMDLQTDAVRHGASLPETTLHPPVGERLETATLRVLDRLPGAGGLVERMRELTAERDYEVAWARFHAGRQVIDDLEGHESAGAHPTEIVDDVVAQYRYWQEEARRRLDQTAELFPEFVAAAQARLAGRMAIQAQREAIAERARSGAIPGGVAAGILKELDHRLVELKASRGSRFATDPEELLRAVPFFEGLPRPEFQQVAERLKRRTAPADDVIVAQGDRGSSLFLIARGVVRVTRVDDGEKRDIATLMAGDFFGEMALLHHSPRTATCRAVTPCALWELARSDLDAALESCPSM